MVQCVDQRCAAENQDAAVRSEFWLMQSMADGQWFDLRCQSHPRDRCSLNLAPCFTPVESPESNGMAEARPSSAISPDQSTSRRPDRRIGCWMEDYSSEHPHSRLGYCSPREYICILQQAACPV